MSTGLPVLAPRPLLQAAVVSAIVVFGQLVDWSAGLGALLAMALVWPPAVALRPARAGHVLRCYLPFILGWLLFVFVYLRVMHAAGVTVAPQAGLQDLADHGTALPGFALTCVVVVVLAPAGEEMVFRGYLFTALATLLPRWATHLLTAAAFGLVHGLAYALPIGVLSLLFAWLRERHRALLPAFLAHALHNGLTVALTVCWPEHLRLLYPT